ncbi:hypothetical protein LDENG_00297360 [Lucifuga dentata]|nr:hypothetical protein LDENG_00297360 [Lucifuga dentata]
MGVQGLWRLLESTGRPINPETLEGKILAVDISIWLNQAVKGVRDRDGNSVQNAHLLTLFHRICKLLFFRIRPVFVFDGDAPLLKKQTLALRRQRKEELSRESKQTNEKLLKTFLKRQAIKAALGDHSKDPLPSISSVRRDEVDNIYVLPALPPAEEKDKNSSEEEEDKEWEEMIDSYHMYQGELYDDPNSVDINSEDFASLPPEMKHEILKDMKEFSKRRRTMYHKPPEHSGDFSQYQLAGLLQRNQLNQRLEGVEREMSQRSAHSAAQLYQQDDEQQSHNIESQRLVSEDFSHYILIKGSKKSGRTADSQAAALPWSGSPLLRCKRQGEDRPEPLWWPICDDEDSGGPSSDSKYIMSKTFLSSQGSTSPPSPHTLRAIQAAMSDSSDEEKKDQEKRNGAVSPRTLLAIQQALEDDGITESRTVISNSPNKLQAHVQHPVPQLDIISSEEEREPDDESNSLSNDNSKVERSLRGQSLSVKDNLLVSSSEDELEEARGQRNRVLHSAVLQQSHRSDKEETEREKEGQMKAKEDTNKRESKETDISTESGGLSEKQDTQERRESEHRQITESQKPSSFCPLLSERKSEESVEIVVERSGHVKTASSEGSESEDSFIEVSEEEEFKEEDGDNSFRGRGPPDEVYDEETKKEEKREESPPSLKSEEEEDKSEQIEEEELKESTETDCRSAAATNEWENIDVDELEALQSSLQAEQSSLREQKQQQERMASTVTGQMCLESQELLRLFGVPFLVAPMEAEAQCAALDRADQTNGTITDDSDVWLFGGRHVYKNFFSQNKYVRHYQFSDLQNQLGLDRTKLINLAYLLGSDYTEGLPGVGYVTGMEILNEFPGPGLEPLIKFSKWWSEAQENKRLVSDPRDSKNRFGWNSRKTEETLQPVIKQLNSQQTQLRIDSFFRLEQQEKQAIRSQRLRRAVICLKRKEREGREEEDNDGTEEEEETMSPPKSKKGKAANQTRKRGGGEVERLAAGGGFLGSQLIVESPLASLKDVSQQSESLSVHNKTIPPPKTVPQSSSSSDEDSDGVCEVAMVTARSVFKGNRSGRGAKHTRGRGRGKGKKLKE